jgi:O-methyltransferase
VEKIEIDWVPLRIPEASVCAALVRAREIDRRVLAFIMEGGRTAVVSIGSGLDTRMTRLASIPDVWVDIELPEVAALRKILVPDEGPARTISSSFLDTGWIDEVRSSVSGARILLVAEGVLNYLPPTPLATVLLRTAEVLGPCTLLADVMSRFFAVVARFLAAVRKTGARIEWGASKPSTFERLFPIRLRGLEVYLDPEDHALGDRRGMYRLAIFRDMSRLLVADLVEE